MLATRTPCPRRNLLPTRGGPGPKRARRPRHHLARPADPPTACNYAEPHCRADEATFSVRLQGLVLEDVGAAQYPASDVLHPVGFARPRPTWARRCRGRHLLPLGGADRQAPVLSNEAITPISAEEPGRWYRRTRPGPGADSPVIVGGALPDPAGDNQRHLKAIGAGAQGVDVMRAPVMGVMADSLEHDCGHVRSRRLRQNPCPATRQRHPAAHQSVGASRERRWAADGLRDCRARRLNGVPGVNPTLSVAAVESPINRQHYPEVPRVRLRVGRRSAGFR